ncbi:MAG: serine/threonine protein kinase [Crenarchaeota archaeon]|nr:serine/threonine protein kinase [Thermoproteota archaeon]
MNTPLILTLNQLREAPYSAVLCYPKLDDVEIENRIKELACHNVDAVEFSGQTKTYGLPAPILGKGFVGLVVVAYLNKQKIALKIRRMDSDRENLLHEANMLQKANTVGVGPKYVASSKNFLLMQLIDGDLLPQWLKTHKEKTLMQQVLCEILESCYRLDELGLDHGELSKAPKHVIVDCQNKPYLIDFETASENRKTANLPAMCHFLFNSWGETGQLISQVFGKPDSDKVVALMRQYKKSRTRKIFEQLLETCFDVKK